MVNPNDQISEAVRLAEESRRRAKEDADRQIADMRQRSDWMQSMSVQAMQQRAVSGISSIAQPARSLGSAIGYSALGPDIQTQHGFSMPYQVATYGGYSPSYGYGGGPLGRPTPGGFSVAGQSFMGLLYDLYISPYAGSAKLGQTREAVALRQATELGRRGGEFVHGFSKYVAPLVGDFSSPFTKSQIELGRDVESRFGHVVSGSTMPGGRGISTATNLGRGISDAIGAVSLRQAAGSGYAYTADEMMALNRSALQLFGSQERSLMAERGSGRQQAVQARKAIQDLTEKMGMDADTTRQFVESYGGLLYGPEGIIELAKDVTTAIQNNIGGGLTGQEMGNMLSILRQQNNKLGMSAAQARDAALGTATGRGTLLTSYRAGLISREALFAYGGNSQDEAALLFTLAQQRAGLTYSLSNPAIAGMFASDRGRAYMANVAIGRGPSSQVDFLTDVAQNVVNDPYAGLRAKYSGRSRQAALDMGFSLAVAQAEREADMAHVLTNNPEDRQALIYERLSRLTGEQDPAKVKRLYQAEKAQIALFSGAGISEQTARERSAIYKLMARMPNTGANMDRAMSVVSDIQTKIGYDKFSQLTEEERIYAVQAAAQGYSDSNKLDPFNNPNVKLFGYYDESTSRMGVAPFKVMAAESADDVYAVDEYAKGVRQLSADDMQLRSTYAAAVDALGGPAAIAAQLTSAGYTEAEINAALDKAGSQFHMRNRTLVHRTREDVQATADDYDAVALSQQMLGVRNLKAEERARANIRAGLEDAYAVSSETLLQTSAEFTGGPGNKATYNLNTAEGKAAHRLAKQERERFAKDIGLSYGAGNELGKLSMTNLFRESATDIQKALIADAQKSGDKALEAALKDATTPEKLLEVVNSDKTSRELDNVVLSMLGKRAAGARGTNPGSSPNNPLYVRQVTSAGLVKDD